MGIPAPEVGNWWSAGLAIRFHEYAAVSDLGLQSGKNF
jgi:hypothetical protein